MEKRKITFFIALFGVILIIFSSTYIKFSQSVLINETDYLNSNLRTGTKKCVLDNKCSEPIITLKNLIDNNYLNEDILNKVKEYDLNSYIVYPSNEVVLIKAD